MTNLSRLTLAAALLGGMALPAFAQPVAVLGGSPAISAKLHRHTHHVAATDSAMSKDAMSKETTKAAPAVAGKEAVTTTSKDAATTMPKDAATAMPKDAKDVPAGKTAVTTPAPTTSLPGSSTAATVKPAVPGQTSQAPSAAPKVN